MICSATKLINETLGKNMADCVCKSREGSVFYVLITL